MDPAAFLYSSRLPIPVWVAVSILVVFLLPVVLTQDPNICGTKGNGGYACPSCSASASTSTSSRGAAFEANLLRLRDSLRDMAAANASFLNATFGLAGGGGGGGDTVYGLATCLADAEMPDCAACLAGAADELAGAHCGSRRDMVLWYPRCLVRYDNASFFGAADTSPDSRLAVPNPNNFSDPAALDKARERLGGRMLAAAAGSPVRLAFGDERVNANTTLHGLAQCTEDLTSEECTRCLATHVVWLGVCCANMDGVRLIGPSCYLRYELMAFEPATAPSMAPLAEPPPPSAPGAPSGTGSSSSSRKKSRTYVLAGALSGVALLLLGICLITTWWYKKRSSGSRNRVEFLLQQHQQHPRRYSYAQLKRMTRSFTHKLGQGGNGEVYKGSLPDGGEVAVKMLKEAKVDGEEFINEVASISRTSHVNVVTMLGFCLEGSGPKSKRGLVYEYMPNDSLERYTAGGDLGWEQLLSIAVGIARGLEYLHRGCNAHIVHFDIKPHNILLDAELRPKISDFGLAKLRPQRDSTIPVSIAGARGTVGYIAPEVFSRQVGLGAVTSKSDVYSYGMMVLEMVGARRDVNNGGSVTTGVSGGDSIYFPECLYQDLDGFCASACGPDEEAGSAEMVRKMVIVGLWCIRMSPADRPSMSRVVEMLEKTMPELELPPEAADAVAAQQQQQPLPLHSSSWRTCGPTSP